MYANIVQNKFYCIWDLGMRSPYVSVSVSQAVPDPVPKSSAPGPFGWNALHTNGSFSGAVITGAVAAFQQYRVGKHIYLLQF